MYLIRRTYKTKPYEAVNAAKLIKEQADMYTAIKGAFNQLGVNI